MLMFILLQPHLLPSQLDKYKFNWTLSYMIDSEVSDCSYGCSYSNPQPIVDESQEAYKKFVLRLHKEFKQRQNAAVWFVSNCKANFRNEFALKLKNLINVRIFGACGEKFTLNIHSNVYYFLYKLCRFWVNILSIPFDTLRSIFGSTFSSSSSEAPLSQTSYECKSNTECEYQHLRSNLFYFSFESRNCSNYITEKLWRILNTYMIPIVIQPSRSVYEQVAPENSFIHAEDFDFDATRLAAYLNSISTDFERYLFHHKWRLRQSVVHSAAMTEPRRLCQLCTRLNTDTSAIYYEKISQWFSNKCSSN